MAERILIVNPASRPGRRTKRKASRPKSSTRSVRKNPARSTAKGSKSMARKKQRSAAQRAATRRLVAMNKARAKARKGRKSNPSPRRRTRRAASPRAASAPAPRRRRSPARAAAPVRRRRRTVRRNPVRMNMRNLVRDFFTPALNGAAGSLVVDAMFANLPFPEMLKTGNGRHAGKAIMALGLAYVGSMVAPKQSRHVMAMAVGSLTVTGHEIGRQLMAQFVPQIRLDGLSQHVGAYVSGPGAMGYTSSAPITGYNSMPADGSMGAFITGPGAPRSSGMGAYVDGGMPTRGMETESTYYGR